jgi:hypothetical protein
VDVFTSYISIDTLTGDVMRGEAQDAPLPVGHEEAAGAAPAAREMAEPRDGEEWSENFARSLQEQHGRIRRFLQAHGERWRKMVAHFTRQIEKLQAAVADLTTDNDALREQAERAAEVESRGDVREPPRGNLTELVEPRGPSHGNADAQRPARPASYSSSRAGPSLPAGEGNDWESQKRRMLAELESDDAIDVESTSRRLQIEEVIERTDKMIAEKDREIEELKHLLDNQSSSVGSLAVGAAALEHVFDQDEMIREERQRLQQAQDELREKLRQSEIDHAMERARLARREAEIEERLRDGDARQSAAENDAEALAPTGRPVRGRWRTQMGLGDRE